MKKKATKLVFVLILLVNFHSGMGQRPREDSITDKLFALPEVKAKNKFIDSITNHKHGISMIVRETAANTHDYYEIQAGYNNDFRFESYYTFYVYGPKWKIKLMDPVTGKIIDLQTWRRKQ